MIVANEFGTKPEPVTVTTFPAGPLAGLVKIEGTITVNVLEAEWEEASVARTVFAPVEEDGTVNVVPAGMSPVPVVVTVVCINPLNLIVVAELAANPEPVTATVVPVGPVVGLIEIEGDIEKVADFVLVKESVAVTVWAPNVDDGAEKVIPAGIDPVEVVVNDRTAEPSYVTVVAELGA